MVGLVHECGPRYVVLMEVWQRNQRLLGAYLDLCALVGIEPKEFETDSWHDLRQQLNTEFRQLYAHCLRYGIDVSCIDEWWQK